MKRRIAVIAGCSVILIIAVLAVRTLLVPTTNLPRPGAVAEVLDETSAVQHLAGAIRFPTISDPPSEKTAADAFEGLTDYLDASFPRVHSALRRERIGAHSLLYTWQGMEPGLPGILFLAHMDIVPVEPGSEASWTHPPYSGDVADGYMWVEAHST